MNTNPSFVVLSAQDPAERLRWLKCWESCPEHEPSAHPGYVELFARNTDLAMCAVTAAESEDLGVLFPFILRPLAAEPWVMEGTEGDGAWDLTSPYGYGGAFRWGEADPGFWDAFAVWATSRGVVCSFVRQSLFPEEMLRFPGPEHAVQANVVRRLDVTDQDLWMDYEHKVRKNVRRAQLGGVAVRVEQTTAHLEVFHAIYLDTMQRRHARVGYHFPISFFEGLASEIPEHLAFFYADAGGKTVAAELVLLSTHRAYSFLGGTLADAFQFRPNDLLKHEIIRWARDQGRTHFVLGGGASSDDGIFRYKKSFAPSGVVPFTVGRWVHDHTKYSQLVRLRAEYEAKTRVQWAPATDFFPAYRSR